MSNKCDPWGRPVVQAGDGHDAWGCNNRYCSQHPAYLYRPRATPGDINKLAVEVIAEWLHNDRQDSLLNLGRAYVATVNTRKPGFVDSEQTATFFRNLAGMCKMSLTRQRAMCAAAGL